MKPFDANTPVSIEWNDFKRKTAEYINHDLGGSLADFEFAALNIHEKVSEAIKRIEESPFTGFPYSHYVGHSGGKDSVLVRFIVDQISVRFVAGQINSVRRGTYLPTVHTPKPSGVRNAVHPLTREFVYSLDRPVLYIPEGHTETTLKRFQLSVQIDGTRRAEASRRDGRDVGLIVNGEERSRSEVPLYLDNGLFGLRFIYPIYDWSDFEVWAAIFAYDIPYSEEYNHLYYE